MHPIICQLGPVTVYSYGVMLAAAVALCTFLAARDARKIGVPADFVYDLVFWVVLSGIFGARLFYVVLHWEFFWESPAEIVMIPKGGLAWQGGLTAAFLTGAFFVKRKGLPLARILDWAAPYAALGQAIGRIGCFLNGCCHGREAAWGIFFPVHQARLHPTQLYDALGLLAVFLFLKRYQKNVRVEGRVFILYVILACLLRFVVEFFRDDHETLGGGLSIYQYVCLGLIAAASYAHLYLKSRRREPS